MTYPVRKLLSSPTSLTGYPGRLLLGASCVLVMLMGLSSHRSADTATGDPVGMFGRVVHWRDRNHDWLLVADRAARQLVVYDAVTGAPVRRLGAGDGIGEIDAIAPVAGDHLVVQQHAAQMPRLLELPTLRPVALASR